MKRVASAAERRSLVVLRILIDVERIGLNGCGDFFCRRLGVRAAGLGGALPAFPAPQSIVRALGISEGFHGWKPLSVG